MWRKLFCAASLLAAAQAWAGSNDVMVDKVWMRESVPGQKSATVMLNLTVTKEGRLVSLTSPVAAECEIQGVVMRHGKPQTAVVDSLRLPAHTTTLFGTRGVYLTLVGLKQPLVAGSRVPLTLTVDAAGHRHVINVEAEVRPLELSYQHYNDPTVKDHR